MVAEIVEELAAPLDVRQDPLAKGWIDRGEMGLQDRINDRRVGVHTPGYDQDRPRSCGEIQRPCEPHRVALSVKSPLRHRR